MHRVAFGDPWHVALPRGALHDHWDRHLALASKWVLVVTGHFVSFAGLQLWSDPLCISIVARDSIKTRL